MPLVGASHSHHVNPLMMVEIMAVEDGMPISEVLLTINKLLRRLSAFVELHHELQTQNGVQGAPVPNTPRPDNLIAVSKTRPHTHVILHKRIITMPHVKHLFGVLLTESRRQFVALTPQQGTAALLTLEQLVFGLEERAPIHVTADNVSVVFIVGVRDLLITELVVPRWVARLGIDDTAIMGNVLLTGLPDGGCAGVRMPRTTTAGQDAGTGGGVSNQSHD